MKGDASIAISDDLFGIAERAKRIDPSYKFYYNKRKRRFEVRSDRCDAAPIVLPFDRLDARALTYLRKTRIERLDALAAEIEERNRREEQRRLSEAKSLAQKRLDGIL